MIVKFSENDFVVSRRSKLLADGLDHKNVKNNIKENNIDKIDDTNVTVQNNKTIVNNLYKITNDITIETRKSDQKKNIDNTSKNNIKNNIDNTDCELKVNEDDIFRDNNHKEDINNDKKEIEKDTDNNKKDLEKDADISDNDAECLKDENFILDDNEFFLKNIEHNDDEDNESDEDDEDDEEEGDEDDPAFRDKYKEIFEKNKKKLSRKAKKAVEEDEKEMTGIIKTFKEKKIKSSKKSLDLKKLRGTFREEELERNKQ